jgi:hypothetical protein
VSDYSRKLLLRAVVVGVALIGLFVFFFITPAHDPEPNGLQVAVVGESPPVEELASRLESRDFEVERVATAEEAEERIDDRDVYGAFVEQAGAPPRLLVASGASVPVADLLMGIAEDAGITQVDDVKPTDPDDPRGVTINILVLALVITSILTALVAVQMVPGLRALGPRVAAAAVAAVIGGLIALGIVKAEGALPGPFIAELAVVALAIFAVAICSAGIIRLIGPAGVGAPFLLFLMLGNPASGQASAPELLPTPWYPLGLFLPPGALGDALRGVAYFDGAQVLLPVIVLLVWAALGVGLNELASRKAGPEPAT